jgi:hypothetical protein
MARSSAPRLPRGDLPQQEYFILVAADSYGENGDPVSAYDAAFSRLKAGRWPIYERTRHRKDFKSGDRIVVYIAGDKKAKQSFIASGQILMIEEVNRMRSRLVDSSSGHAIKSYIVLNELKFLNPVSIHSKKENLEFFPVDNKKWGTILMGGVRKISEGDYGVICSE